MYVMQMYYIWQQYSGYDHQTLLLDFVQTNNIVYLHPDLTYLEAYASFESKQFLLSFYNRIFYILSYIFYN